MKSYFGILLEESIRCPEGITLIVKSVTIGTRLGTMCAGGYIHQIKLLC